jgi:signal transduction histidine kinase
VDTTIVPFLNDRGKPYRYVAIRHEITDLKKAEEVLSEIREAERGRISRELHDVVLQDLTCALQKVRDGGPAQGKADEIAAALERSVSGLRSAVRDLRQEETGGGSFVRSVQALVELNRRMSPDREVEFEVEEGFPDELPARHGLVEIGRKDT